jgi:hypothetical protein
MFVLYTAVNQFYVHCRNATIYCVGIKVIRNVTDKYITFFHFIL